MQKRKCEQSYIVSNALTLMEYRSIKSIHLLCVSCKQLDSNKLYK